MAHDATSLGDGQVIKETDQALLIELEDGSEKWIPKSCIHDDSEVWQSGQSGEVIVKSWFAEREGLT